jgi:hypothetical protein
MRHLTDFSRLGNVIYVYDGRRQVGLVICVRGRWEAYATDGEERAGGRRQIGTFASSKAAADALYDHRVVA